MNKLNNYYEVIAKCGHVGRKHYVPIKFAVIAENGREAAKKVREFGRVKHGHKDAILNVNKIDHERFKEINKVNDDDPYLKCHSKHEQKLIYNLEERLVYEPHTKIIKYDKKTRKERIVYKIKKAKIQERLCWEDLDYDYAY